MEDMSKCRVGDLFGKLKDAELAVKNLARFHAKWWNNEQLYDMPWGTFFSLASGQNDPDFL